MQMSFYVVLNLGVYRLDVTRNIQIVVIFLNLTPFYQSAIMWYGLLGIPSIYDVFDILFTKAVLRTIFRKAVFGINDKDTLTAILVFLVDDDDGSRNTCTKENIANVLWTWYKEQLTPITERLVAKWEQILGVKATTWTIQQMQSSWGKCHKESGKIMFNLQLAKKPLNCIEYVIAHELTHLIEQNHTDRFRHILGTYLPGWQKIKEQLNEFPL